MKKGLIYIFKRTCYRLTIKPIIKIIHSVNAHVNQKKIDQSQNAVIAFKNTANGKRCFIIGNGPSLKVEDLSKLELNREITFATNRIYEMFDKTNWRPTYYCVQDRKLIKQSVKDIENNIRQRKFVGIVKFLRYPKINNSAFLNMLIEGFYPNLPAFSEDISKCLYEGYTVTYMCIQLATYMGFKELYLLGVDHNYSTMIDPNGNLVKQDGVKDHFSDEDKIAGMPHLENSTLAYKAAKKYADEHGIKIYNATRGGKLEVFERVDFDSLFPSEKKQLEKEHENENRSISTDEAKQQPTAGEEH